MPIEAFDLDAELSAKPKAIAAVNWVSRDPVAIAEIAPYANDPRLAIVTTVGDHKLNEGDRIFIGGFEFMVDGFYKVIDHPHSEVKKEKCFAIERPERLEGKAIAGGQLYRPASFSVWYVDHLPLAGAAEMKKLEVDKLTAYRALSKYQEFSGISTEIMVQVESLAKLAKIKPDQEAEFGERMGKLKDADDLASAIASIKADFGIKLKTFDERAKAIAELTRAYVEKVSEVEIDETLIDALTGRITDLQKREIEILCHMPHGLMSALDNLSSIGSTLDKIYAYVTSAHREASEKHQTAAPVGNDKPQNS